MITIVPPLHLLSCYGVVSVRLNTPNDSTSRPHFAPWLQDAVCILLLALPLLAIFWPVLFGGKTLLPTDEFDTMTLPFSADYGPPQAYNHNLTDGMMQSYPWKVYAQQAFRNGEIAYWNPLILGGYPQYATSRQTFDVFNVLLIPFDLPFALHLIFVLQLFVAGCGMYLLLRWQGRTRPIALMFATAWMLNGMFLAHGLNLWATATFCWVPFALAMLLRYHIRHQASYLFWAGLFTGLAFLATTLQVAIFVVFILVVIHAFQSRSSKTHWTRFIATTSVFFSVGFCLSAIMWLPSLELFWQVTQHGWLYSPTHGHSYTFAQRVLSLLLLPTFFIPELLGQVGSLSLTTIVGVHPLDFSGYIGFAELLMSAWAVFTLRRSDPRVRGYGWLMIFGFLLPICTPLFTWLYHRFFIVGTLGAVVLGAERLQSFMTNETERRNFRNWAIGALCVAGLLILALGGYTFAMAVRPALHDSIFAQLLERSQGTPFADGNAAWVIARIEGTLHHYALTSPTMFVPLLSIVGICSLLLIRNKWKVSDSIFVVTLFALSVLPTMFWWRTWQPMIDTLKFPLLPANRTINFLQKNAAGYRVFMDRTLVKDHQYVFLDNLPSMYGISEISGYESELSRCYYGALGGVSSSNPHPRSFGVLGIKYFMYLTGIAIPPGMRVVDTGEVVTYENPWARPRATILYSTEVLPNDSTLLHHFFDETSENNSVLFTNDVGIPSRLSDTSLWTEAEILHSTTNTVTIRANALRKGYLLLSDTYYPGWHCFVDGKDEPIYRADFSLRAVYLNAGSHIVEFRFDPLSYTVGKWISLLSLCGVVGFMIVIRIRSARAE